jgi:hypothetical protein
MSDPAAQEAHAERVRANVAKAEALGRWPANLVLQHLDGCRQEGFKRVVGSSCRAEHVGLGREGLHTNGIYGAKVSKITQAHVDPDGTETVAAWACAEGCPVAALDAQSGVLHPRGNVNPSTNGGSTGASFKMPRNEGNHHTRPELNVAGGASRFFKQFHDTTKE